MSLATGAGGWGVSGTGAVSVYDLPHITSSDGAWGVSGTGVVSVGEVGGDPVIPAPPAGGNVTPPAAPAPAAPAVLVAAGVYPLRHVWEAMGAPTLDAGGRPVNWVAAASGNAPYAYVQIVVEGVDITRFDGAETPFPSWRRGEPFGSQSATISLPQITAFHATPTWAAHGANVAINLVRVGDATVLSCFEGFVMDVGTREDAGVFSLECMGVLFGADLQLRPPAFTTAPQDIGSLIPSLLNGLPSRRWPTMAQVSTGISTSVAGGWEPILTGYVQELLATAVKDGQQWTVKCLERTPSLELKDLTTIAWEVREGQRGVTIDLNSDASQAPNVLFGEGVAPDGGSWRNARYPNWKPDDTPAYPNTDPDDTIRVGRYDSGTDSGTGVSVWQAKAGQPVTGYFSNADRVALRRIQTAAGITVDGILGPQSWATTFDTGANTGTLDGAFTAPLAASPLVMPRLFGPDGDDLGPNPAFDPNVVRVESKISYGQGVTKATAITNAIELLARDASPGWAGTVTFEGIDPQSKSRFELREGENGIIRGHRGADLTVHVSAASYAEAGVSLTVDTKARDYPTLQAVLARDRDAVDAAKVEAKRLLSGSIVTDSATFDAESPAGRMPRHAVFSNLWDVRRIPMGAMGSIARTEFTTSGPASAFSLAVFGKPVTAAALLSVVDNPLWASENPWQSDEIDALGLLQAWGWEKQQMGYYPGTYSDPDGVTTATLTGRLVDDASWRYATESVPWIWVATIAENSCYVEGRFFGASK